MTPRARGRASTHDRIGQHQSPRFVRTTSGGGVAGAIKNRERRADPSDPNFPRPQSLSPARSRPARLVRRRRIRTPRARDRTERQARISTIGVDLAKCTSDPAPAPRMIARTTSNIALTTPSPRSSRVIPAVVSKATVAKVQVPKKAPDLRRDLPRSPGAPRPRGCRRAPQRRRHRSHLRHQR